MHVVAMLLIAGALAAGNVVCVRHAGEMRDQHAALLAKLEKVPDQDALVKTRQAELEKLQNIQLAYQELGSPVPMSAVIQQIQNDMNPGMTLSQVAIEVQPEAVKGSGFVGDNKAPPKFHDVARLTVVGVSPNDEQVVHLIQKLSGNPLFGETAQPHWQHLRRVMAAALSEEDLRVSVWDEHEGILRALEAGQAAEAEALCRGHAEQMADILTGRLKVVISRAA